MIPKFIAVFFVNPPAPHSTLLTPLTGSCQLVCIIALNFYGQLCAVFYALSLTLSAAVSFAPPIAVSLSWGRACWVGTVGLSHLFAVPLFVCNFSLGFSWHFCGLLSG